MHRSRRMNETTTSNDGTDGKNDGKKESYQNQLFKQ